MTNEVTSRAEVGGQGEGVGIAVHWNVFVST